MKNTIQRIVVVALMFSLCTPILVIADEVKQIEFSGFDFGGYRPSTDGLDVEVDKDIKKIIDNTNPVTVKKIVKEDGKDKEVEVEIPVPFALVGHSQGGLRVLAAATRLKSENPERYKNLKAVITVSGITKGLKALEGGFPAIRSKFNSDVNTLWRGARATAGVFYLGHLLPRNIDGILVTVLGWIPGLLGDYIAPALKVADPNSMAEIRDMMPRSEFIKENVVNSEYYVNKVQTDTGYSWEWRSYKRWIFRIYYLQKVPYPIYSYYTGYNETSRLDKELPIGYIVGLDSNTLKMSGEEGTIRDVMYGLRVGFGITEGLHYAKCAGIWGLFTGSLRYARDARAARHWVSDIDGQLNELKGSNQNDGLVALESQYLSTKIHSNVLGGDYFAYPQYNHDNIDPLGNSGNTHIKGIINRLLETVQ